MTLMLCMWPVRRKLLAPRASMEKMSMLFAMFQPTANLRAGCGSTLTPSAPTGSNVCRADNHPIQHDLLIPNRTRVDEALENLALKNLIKDWHLHHPGGRIASVCSGALLLANAGILDGKLVTTHWPCPTQIIRRFPNVRWDPDRSYILQDGKCTSAGVATGIAMAL